MQMRNYTASRVGRPASGLALMLALGLTSSLMALSAQASHQGETILPNSASSSSHVISLRSAALEASSLAAVEQLHHFQYDDANVIYRKIIDERAAEPYRTRAYWGLLMALNHPLWHEQKTEEARRILRQYESEAIVPQAGRDNDLMQAVKHLYDPNQENKKLRDNAYLHAMANIYRADPQNDDTASFYALALLAQSATLDGDARLTGRAEARVVLERVYDRNPDHPGTLHYLIHAFDGGMASEHYGLGAAMRYSKFGASAHALHMPSHIFMPRGMWAEIITGETKAWEHGKARAVRIQKEQSLPHPSYDIHAIHSLQWLHYAHLQTGNMPNAETALNEMVELHRADPNPMATWYLARTYATHLVEALHASTSIKTTEKFARQLAALDMGNIELSAAASRLYALGSRVAHQRSLSNASKGQMERAIRLRYLRQILVQLEADIHATKTKLAEVDRPQVSYFTGADKNSLASAEIMLLQLKGLSETLAGNKGSADVKLVAAAEAEQRLPPSYGPPVPVKPASELLGEYYLPTDATKSRAAFEAALRRNANRLIATQGANGTLDRFRIVIE